MRKLLLTCAVALCLPFAFVACGGEDPPDEPTVATPTAPPDEIWFPDDDRADGVPNSGDPFDPCSRAACWENDRRKWVSNPPWDKTKQPGVPQMNGGQPAKQGLLQVEGDLPPQTDDGQPVKKLPVPRVGQQH